MGLLDAPAGSTARVSRIRGYGHSYMFGQGASSPSNSLFNQLCGSLGAQPENFGIGGASSYLTASGVVTRTLQSVSPAAGAPWAPAVQMAVVYAGLNDIGLAPVMSDLSTLTDSLRDVVLRLRAGGVIENSDSAFSFTQGGGASNWGLNAGTTINSGPNNRQANSNGNTFTLTLRSDFPGGTLELHGIRTQGYGGTWAITVDGSAYGTWDTRGATSSLYTPSLYEITGLAPGTHTITGVVSNIGTGDFIDYAQVPAADPPVVVFCLLNRAMSYPNSSTHTIVDADIPTVNTALTTMLSRFTDGRVITVDTDSVLAKTALYFGDGAGGGDPLHPNDAGHSLLARAIKNAVIGRLPSAASMAKSRVYGADVQYARRVPSTGQDPRIGTATLVAGTVAITSRALTANTIVQITRKTPGAAPGFLSYTVTAASGTTAGTLTITSSSGTDTGQVHWELVEPV